MAKERIMDYNALKEKLNDAKEKIMEIESKFEDKVSEHPVKSVLIAFGVGIVAGTVAHMLMRRRE